MAKLFARDGTGRVRTDEVASRAEVEALGMGKKWSVSLDGGATFRPYRDVTSAEWAAFLPGGNEHAGERPPLPETGRAVGSAPTRPNATDDAALSRRADALEERVHALTARVATLAEAGIGRDDLAALREGLQREVAALQEAGRAHLEEAIGPRVEHATAAVAERIERQLARLRREASLLEDLTTEQVESVGRYRPGTIETLRQQLDAERAEVERLRERSRTQTQALDERDREIARLRAAEGAVDPSVLERQREEVARLRSELETRRGVEAERDDLRLRVGELEVLRERSKAAQQLYESDLEVRREVERLRGEEQRLASECDAVQRQRERAATQRDDLRERLARREEQLRQSRVNESELQERVAAHEQAIAALEAERDASQAARDGAIARAAQAEARFATLQRELADDARRRREAEEAAYAQRREAVRLEVERDARRELDELRANLRRVDGERGEALRRATQAEERASRFEQEAHTAREEQRRWRADEGERAARVREFEVRIEALRADCQRTEERLDRLRAEGKELQTAEAERRAHALADLEGLTVQVASQRAALEILEDEIGRRRGEGQAQREARVEILESHYFEPDGGATHPQTTEGAWLADVRGRMEAAGFQFSRRIVESFHTSLKIAAWAPLTVLAGVSGTGKSELPRLYSLYGGLRFLPVPVQPNWDSPQDLFGFFDYVGGRFRATPLVRAMVQSQRSREEGGFDDGMLLVLLDEMNLARVELYFSELLSRLETRRGLDRATARQQCAVAIDLGAGVKEYALPLGENVLWAGTMNEDESTQTLSDKVLDRGNVLTFPRPHELHLRGDVPLGEAAARLPRRTWEGWLRRPEETLDDDARLQMRDAIGKINDALSGVQRAVGHRVMQAIERYVANHPRVCGRASGALTEAEWRIPFEDQLVQKVMPKLRGVSVDARAGRTCLEGVRGVLDASAPGLVHDFERARHDAQGAFVWNQASYLDEKEA